MSIRPESDPLKAGFYQRIIFDENKRGGLRNHSVEEYLLEEPVPKELRLDLEEIGIVPLDKKIEAITDLASRDPDDTLQEDYLKALRVVVREHDRPTLPTLNSFPDYSDFPYFLRDELTLAKKSKVLRIMRSVGRIDIDGNPVGTGMYIGGGRILTNYHVFQHAAARRVRENPILTIDFSDEPGDDGGRRFLILDEIPQPAEVEQQQRSGKLDVAALQIEQSSCARNTMPQPVPITREVVDVAEHTAVMVVGYPVEPLHGSLTAEQQRLVRQLNTSFRNKTLSPGKVISGLPKNKRELTFLHDASTFSGNSGSAIISSCDSPRVIGIHSSGLWHVHNRAYCLAQVLKVAPTLFP